MSGSWLVVAAFSLFTLLLYLVGVYMVWMPRQCAVLAEVFAASGNLPSLIPRSIRGAIFQMRVMGLFLLGCSLFFVGSALTPMGTQMLFGTATAIANPNWLVFPSLLMILAGDVVMFDVAAWVAHTLDFWIDHPLVPRQMIPAMHWAIRLTGMAIFLFGAGVFWVWLGTMTR
ncbi:MAG: hypothetical protein KGL59_02125 [Acidobacteriota bacterium]|nr:hypothetical protein [Acidobacteriota bacterium]